MSTNSCKILYNLTTNVNRTKKIIIAKIKLKNYGNPLDNTTESVVTYRRKVKHEIRFMEENKMKIAAILCDDERRTHGNRDFKVIKVLPMLGETLEKSYTGIVDEIRPVSVCCDSEDSGLYDFYAITLFRKDDFEVELKNGLTNENAKDWYQKISYVAVKRTVKKERKLNKHGLKMNGLKAASGETCKWVGYTQISYDMETGEVLVDNHAGNSETSWSDYHKSNVITCLNARRHYSMQEIADAIFDKVSLVKKIEGETEN